MSFLALTLIPIILISVLLYKSGYDLSKQSYSNNMIESIKVQVNYVSETLENNMISDYRFAQKYIHDEMTKDEIYDAFQTYLQTSEDKITASIVFDKDNQVIYTTGEKVLIDSVITSIPSLSDSEKQSIQEFQLPGNTYSLGILTPVKDSAGNHQGGMISIYDKSYIFKIVSSYYNIADTSTYIIGGDANVINYRGNKDSHQDELIVEAIQSNEFEQEGTINTKEINGYYKAITNTPWYLAGFLDAQIISEFTNQFIWLYISLVMLVFIADIALAFYFSKKVVQPIHNLIEVMNQYQLNLYNNEIVQQEKHEYVETKYLRTKFFELMKTILSMQHNYDGIYQLYQSSDMGDINIDIDVIEQTIASNKHDFQLLLEQIENPDGACIVERFTRCFCPSDQQKLLDMFEQMRDEHLSIAREVEIYTTHFNQKWYHCVVVPMYANDRLSRLFIQLRDISNFKLQEIQTSEQARRDDLTHLYNRQGFVDLVKHHLQKDDMEALHAILFLDMDYFKLVNDTFGHQMGDEVLKSVANSLSEIIPSSGIISRFGGDEFVIYIPNVTENDIQRYEEEIHRHLRFEYKTEFIEFCVSASIGVYTWDKTSDLTLEDILKQADKRMYEEKRRLKQTKS